jgi:hypothetical protein
MGQGPILKDWVGHDIAKKKFMETFSKVIKYKHNKKN